MYVNEEHTTANGMEIENGVTYGNPLNILSIHNITIINIQFMLIKNEIEHIHSQAGEHRQRREQRTGSNHPSAK